MNNERVLRLIKNEIERLERRQSETGLQLEDVKALEILIRSGQSLLTGGNIDPVPTKDTSNISDDEILQGLSKKDDNS